MSVLPTDQPVGQDSLALASIEGAQSWASVPGNTLYDMLEPKEETPDNDSP